MGRAEANGRCPDAESVFVGVHAWLTGLRLPSWSGNPQPPTSKPQRTPKLQTPRLCVSAVNTPSQPSPLRAQHVLRLMGATLTTSLHRKSKMQRGRANKEAA